MSIKRILDLVTPYFKAAVGEHPYDATPINGQSPIVFDIPVDYNDPYNAAVCWAQMFSCANCLLCVLLTVVVIYKILY